MQMREPFKFMLTLTIQYKRVLRKIEKYLPPITHCLIKSLTICLSNYLHRTIEFRATNATCYWQSLLLSRLFRIFSESNMISIVLGRACWALFFCILRTWLQSVHIMRSPQCELDEEKRT